MFHQIMLYLLSLLPVMLFMGALIGLDSFSLVKWSTLTLSVFWGCLCVVFALYLNPLMMQLFSSRLIAPPVTEEFLKGLGVLFIVKTRRSAFFIDAVLYGVGVGVGFAFAENIFYINHRPDMLLGTALMRGMGTAVMHCGAVAGTAAILNWFSFRTNHSLRYYPLALLSAIILHTLYNALLLPYYLTLIIVVFGVSLWILLLIFYNEKTIGKWLDMEMTEEVKLLRSMQEGGFSQSPPGLYLLSVRERFSAEKFLDMYCYIRIYLELSLLSKRNLMLAEAGLDIPEEKETQDKIAEFFELKKQIGKTGELILAPIVKQDKLLKWKIQRVKR